MFQGVRNLALQLVFLESRLDVFFGNLGQHRLKSRPRRRVAVKAEAKCAVGRVELQAVEQNRQNPRIANAQASQQEGDIASLLLAQLFVEREQALDCPFAKGKQSLDQKVVDIRLTPDRVHEKIDRLGLRRIMKQIDQQRIEIDAVILRWFT